MEEMYFAMVLLNFINHYNVYPFGLYRTTAFLIVGTVCKKAWIASTSPSVSVVCGNIG